MREREGWDGNGEPHAQCPWEWQWGRGYVHRELPWKEDEGAEMMGEGGEGTDDETQGEGGGTQGEGGVGWPCAQHCQEWQWGEGICLPRAPMERG